MKVVGFERLGRWGIGAMLLLLFHGFAAPRSVWAGCSHLVSSRSDRQFDFNQVRAVIAGDQSATLLAADPVVGQGSKRPAPCSGPGCSSRRPMPVPASFLDSDRYDQWVALDTLAIVIGASPPARTIEEPAAHIMGEKPSIFHPPPV